MPRARGSDPIPSSLAGQRVLSGHREVQPPLQAPRKSKILVGMGGTLPFPPCLRASPPRCPPEALEKRPDLHCLWGRGGNPPRWARIGQPPSQARPATTSLRGVRALPQGSAKWATQMGTKWAQSGNLQREIVQVSSSWRAVLRITPAGGCAGRSTAWHTGASRPAGLRVARGPQLSSEL